MDKRLKIQLIDPSQSVKKCKFSCKVLEGECEGFFIDLMNKTAGNWSYADDKWKEENQTGCKLWIVVHSVEDFLYSAQTNASGNIPFAQDLLKTPSDYEGEILPVVHITTTNIFLPSMYTMAPLHRYVPRYHLIVDNSIWNYHVSIFEPNEITFPEDDPNTEFVKKELKSFQDSFLDALASIKNNYERHLYGLYVAREYADLNARLASQAYLTGAHAKWVSPFVFHSEFAVKLMIKNEFVGKDKVIEKIINQKWRILLVDDKAMTKMGCVPSLKPDDGIMYHASTDYIPWNCKLAIIEKNLSHCFGWDKNNKNKIEHHSCDDKKKTNGDCCILIEYAQSLEEAEAAIQNKKYDIILLDYLLDQPNGIHYGYELLDEIYKDQCKHKDNEEILIYKTIKPHRNQRMYCMFISAYSSAVHDQLLAEGLNMSEKYWFISLGACPTNTPQLFLYNLLKLMDKRLEDSGILDLSSSAIYEVINNIYLPKEDDVKGDSVRKKANAFYQEVLSLQYHYRNILKDVEIPFGQNASIFDTKGSVLMTDFIQKKINLGGMLEHLTQLVHLTAFGTIRQWSEMWEEYIYFKALFEKQIEVDNEADEIDCKTLFSNVEKYILDLKSQQQ